MLPGIMPGFEGDTLSKRTANTPAAPGKVNLRLTASLGTFSAVNLLVLFLVQWYTLVEVGAGVQSDALFSSMAVPQFLLVVASGALSYVLLPIFVNLEDQQFGRAAWTFVAGVAMLASLAAVLLHFSSAFWLSLLFPGYAQRELLLTKNLLDVQLPGMIFASVTAVLVATKQSKGQYIRVELCSAMANAASLCFLMLTIGSLGVFATAWAFVLKTIGEFVLLSFGMERYTRPDFFGNDIRLASRRIAPLLAGRSLYKTDELVDRGLSSMTVQGQLSLLFIAQKIFAASSLIIDRALIVPIVPTLTRNARENNWLDFRRLLHTRLIIIFLLNAAMMTVIVLFGRGGLSLLFNYRNFTPESVEVLYLLLIALGGLALFGGTALVLSQGFFALGDTVMPTKLGVISFVAGVAIKILGFLFLGIYGVAIGASLYCLIYTALLYIFLEKKIRVHQGTVTQ
jgi:peptidoglycan biosynthesis protein MviN/MurJ (putative lipid II flippase)